MKKWVIIFCFISLGLLFETFLIYLFPYSELAGLVKYPIALFISILISGILIIFYKSFDIKHIFIGVIIQFFVLISLLPQSRGSVFNQFSCYIKAYKNYNHINYQNFFDYNYAERVVFIYKYRNMLPRKFLFLEIEVKDSISHSYLIEELSNGNFKFGNHKDGLIKNEYIIVYIDDTKTIKIPISIIKNKIWYRDESIMVTISEDNLNIDKGIEDCFYSFLEMKYR